MTALKEAKALRDKALEFIQARSDADYKIIRDKDFNLSITFNDGAIFKLPVIKCRPYQKEPLRLLLSGECKRFAVEWPRRSGKEVLTWQLLLMAAIIDPGMYIISYPNNVRAKKILWQGAALINGISVRFRDMIPARFRARKDNDSDMTIELINGSIIWVVGCDIDPDKLRGTNPRGLVLSEFAFSDPKVMHTMLPVFRQNGGWLFAQSTYDGMNHFFHLLKNNKDDPRWYIREESIKTLLDENGNQYITDEDVDEDRRAGMPEYLIQQEYYGIVTVNEETKYFAIAMNQVRETERIISGLFLPRKKVYAFYDIGVNDCTAITLAQFESKGGVLWANVIGYIENNNRDLRFYVSEIDSFCNRYNLPFATHFVPHDGANRNWNDGLKTSVDYLEEMGEKGMIVKRPSRHKVAVETIRRQLYLTNFNKENTGRLIDCLSSYEKEYDEEKGRYEDKPNHDWSSHGVKSFQTMALAIESKLVILENYDVIYYN